MNVGKFGYTQWYVGQLKAAIIPIPGYKWRLCFAGVWHPTYFETHRLAAAASAEFIRSVLQEANKCA